MTELAPLRGVTEQTYGLVIRAIDAGHIEHGGECATCKTPWSKCSVMAAARKAQPTYAARIQRERAIAAGKLSAV